MPRKTGSERFHAGERPLLFDLMDFWRWAGSDLLINLYRGQLAEYLVGRALGLELRVRNTWDPYDLLLTSGRRVEVKSAAYVQSWKQKEDSRIEFGIGPRTLDASLLEQPYNASALDPKRHADVYVFALLHHKDRQTIDPMNVEQWTFYVLATRVLNEKCVSQEKISLSRLKTLGPCETQFDGIAQAVESSLK